MRTETWLSEPSVPSWRHVFAGGSVSLETGYENRKLAPFPVVAAILRAAMPPHYDELYLLGPRHPNKLFYKLFRPWYFITAT